MAKKLFTKEEAKQFLRENNITDARGIEDALVAQFKDLLQAALEAELDHELGYSKYDWKNKQTNNSRNGHSSKTIRSKFGKTEVKVPRDKDKEFEPTIVKKHERHVNDSVDDMIISMYAHGLSTKDIHSQMERIYGLDVSADMVSRITDKVLPLAKEWQNRPLEPMYGIVFLDGIVFNVREDHQLKKKTAYVVLGINIEGKKEVLGIWIGGAESAKFWMQVLSDLKNRGVKDVLIFSTDGLKGFEDAITAVYPQSEQQRCIVHQVRYSSKFVSYKDRKTFCKSMKAIYTAPNEKAGLQALNEFEKAWGKKYPYAIKSWRDNWKLLATFFKYPPEIRKLIYTTNPIESLHRSIRKVTKTKSSFPTENSLIKLLYLIVMDKTEKWTMPIRDWNIIVNQLSIYFGERVTKYL